jgi:aspartyl-tRNA(Asn)/glutamyl-tRNA(Gln) amidotransferase subunit A
MTRTVRDNALMLQAMAGHDTADATSASEPVPDFQRLIGQSVRGLRLGVPRRFIESSPHDADCLAAFEEALRVLRELGAETVEFDFPVLARVGDAGTRILVAEAYAYHRENLEKTPDKYDVSFRGRLLLAAKQTAEELDEAQAAREELKRNYAALFAGGIDAIVSPGRESISDTMQSLMSRPTGTRGSCTRMYNMSGMPALVMPMGFGANEMPLGIQFAAGHFAEDRVYQLAAAYEAATPWVSRHPPIRASA